MGSRRRRSGAGWPCGAGSCCWPRTGRDDQLRGRGPGRLADGDHGAKRRARPWRNGGLGDQRGRGRPRRSADERSGVVVATLEQAQAARARTGRARLMATSSRACQSRLADLAGFRPAAAHRRRRFKLSPPTRSSERQGRADVGGPVPDPPERGPGAVRGREAPDPGPGPQVAPRPPHDAGHARAAQPRLRPARHHRTLFAALEIATGRSSAPATPSTAQEFMQVPGRIDKAVTNGQRLHVVCDNYGTHKPPGPGLAGPPHPDPHALHPHLLASWLEPGRALASGSSPRPDPIRRGAQYVAGPEQDIRDLRSTSCNASSADPSPGPRPPTISCDIHQAR